MITKEDEYFLRATILLLKGGRLMSKETLYKELQKAGGNLAELLKQHERKFKHKFVKKQREKLFPDAGKTDVETWDLAMLTTVTLKVFKQSLNDDEKNGLKSIKCMRDEIYAHTYSSALSADQYEEIRKELQNALTSLSNGLSEKLKDDCSKIIQECTTGPISPSLKAELTKQIEDTENSFQAVMNKLGNQNEFLCEMKKDIMDKLNTIRVTEDRSDKIIKVIDIELTLSAAVNESKDIDFVEGIITTVINKAIKKVGNENEKDYPKIRSVVDKILKDIENMPDVQILSAEHKCILLKFSCTTYTGILNMLMYMESRSFLDSLNDLALALSSTLPNLGGQFQLDATVTPECMKDLLDELRAKTTYERTIRVPMKVESVQGIEHIWSLFETGGATNRLNELSEAVFDELDTKITVTPSVNLEQVQAAIKEAGEQSAEVSQAAVKDNVSSPLRHQSKSVDEGEQSAEVSQAAVKDNVSSPHRHQSKSVDEGEKSAQVSQAAVKDNVSSPQRHQSKSVDEASMAHKYYRLVSFLVNICPLPLRELFLKYMHADPTRVPTCTTLGAYLASRKRQLQVLERRKIIRLDQWQLLFPRTGQVDESSWDISMLILLLDEFFIMQLQQVEVEAIQDIRGIRNQLHHMTGTSIADADFDCMWSILERATIDLAKQIQPSPAYENTIKEYIDDTTINNMPKLGDSLRYWYEHIIRQLKSEIEDMKESMKEMSHHTADKAKGNKVKRMKTVDQILVELSNNFITTMKEDLLTSFDSPSEVADIKTKLRDVHHVVVTGYRGSPYLETALASIHSMNYNFNRCVEMRNSSDWRHVDPEEVDLVLCREPFGDFTFDEKRTKNMADIFSNMLRTARASDGSKHLDIVIVCEKELLQQVLNVHGHDILEEMVQVYLPTSETTPADLTGIAEDFKGVINAPAHNLLNFTTVFAERNRDHTVHSKTIRDKAKSMLKMHKVVLITGPKKCGKTTLALFLASVYQPHQFLILNKPDDIKLVSLSSICLVLVEDFAGKYRFEEGRACAWLEEFDMLYSVVDAGKLNVIITCEEKLLKKCREEFGLHPILGNIITLQHTDRVVKSEATNGETSNGKSRTQCETPMITDDGQNITESAYTTEKQNASSDALQPEKINRNLHSSDVFFIVEDMCPFGDDKFLFLNTSATVLLLNSDLDVVGTFETHEQGVEKICQTGEQELLIVSEQRLSLYEFKTESIERLQTKNIEHGCDCLAVGEDGEVSILDGNTIYIYSELQLTDSQRLPVKERKEDDEKKMVLFSDKRCVIIAKRNCIQSVMFSSSKHLKRSLHFNKKNVNPIALCTGDDDVFLLCSYKQTHAKIMRYTCDLEKIGVLDLADVHYAPSLTSMMFHRQTSRLLVTCSGNLDEWHWDQLTSTEDRKCETNQLTTAFTRVKTTTTNKMDKLDDLRFFSRHPDGSFLVLQYDDDDDDDDGGDIAIVIHHFSSDFQYIRKYNTDICNLDDFYFGICCTDSGDVVIDDYGKVTLYRITDGTIQNIKSNSNVHARDAMIVNLCFFMNRIYITCDDCLGPIVMLDTNLNVKKQVKLFSDLYDRTGDFPEVLPCVMQKYLYIHPITSNIICDNLKKKQIKYLEVEDFCPRRICAASEDSVFVVGKQGSDDRRILQVNTDMEILSDILLKGKESKCWCKLEKIVFDKVNARLILLHSTDEVEQIYLE